MLLSNLVVAASFLIVTFNEITAIPHIRERHIIRVPIKFKTIHHHKIQKIPIIIRKHIHYNKDKHPEVQHVHFNHLAHDDGHFDIHNEEVNSGISYDHEGGHGTHEYEYEEGEQSEEEEYDDDDDDDEYE